MNQVLIFNRTATIKNSDFWDVRHELCAKPQNRDYIPTFKKIEKRPFLSNAHVGNWVPHGYAVVHSSSPGTGLSQGCPTIGRFK